MLSLCWLHSYKPWAGNVASTVIVLTSEMIDECSPLTPTTPAPPFFPPPHLRTDPLRCYPDWPVRRPRYWGRLLRLSPPPRRQRRQRSGRIGVAGEVAFCCRRDWRTGKPRSLLWPSRDPNRDGIPASSGPPSRAARWVSRELRCLVPPSWWRTERQVRCEGLKQKSVNSGQFLSVNQYHHQSIVVWPTMGEPLTKLCDKQHIKSVVGCWWPGKSASCPLTKRWTCGRKFERLHV